MTSEEPHPVFITNSLHGALQGGVLRSVCKDQLPGKAKYKKHRAILIELYEKKTV